MNIKNWKYVKKLNDLNAVENFETTYNVKFPSDLKDIIKKYNGGRPELKLFDTSTETGKDFKTLLSFNKTDIENIYIFCDDASSVREMLPFASDPAGNLFVLKDGKIFFWNHETDSTSFLADSFTEFLNMLY